ncbi:mannose-1-phosphate guanylyltransferase/mannose-6-phosphate isomerase [Endozoicomonas sp. Mp262]|uniref:mannose-1-phosphate guanylyltransferase/mannose-6-phosphate isomerase n=1 Tax=Endozoicomonas sp. Mp262 TaxID=2919499 RepID=UPI0021DA6CC2
MLVPVIMAGGSGSRLWPYSRQQYPKQFLPCLGEKTMLQETLLRLQGLDCAAPIILCNKDHRFLVAEQLEAIGITDASIIMEPEGRNTAPALALASLMEIKRNPVMLALAADHFIADQDAFRQAVVEAAAIAEQEQLVTFGIQPHSPETGYGYIRGGESFSRQNRGLRVHSFVEKPDLETAIHYLKSGEYFWNSGMFAFKPSVYLEELNAFQPDIVQACEKAWGRSEIKGPFISIEPRSFSECPNESVDYAVMEKTGSAVVLPINCGWSDVGSWSSIMDLTQKDNNGNACHGDVLTVDSQDCYVRSEHRLVSMVGVKDLVVVETSDGVLIANKEDVQSVKRVVDELKRDQRKEALCHREIYRPWGSYDAIDIGHRYQVKRITVKPGASLSLQMHHHRAEHWVVVQGTALITRGDEQIILSENESTFIPLGYPHRLENPGKVNLELIEIQSGSYLGEDDIVRFEDSEASS